MTFNVEVIEGDNSKLKFFQQWIDAVKDREPPDPITVGQLMEGLIADGHPIDVDMYIPYWDHIITDMRLGEPDEPNDGRFLPTNIKGQSNSPAEMTIEYKGVAIGTDTVALNAFAAQLLKDVTK